MAVTPSPDSDSTEPSNLVFTGDRVVTSFPRHDFVKLDEGTFLQWQQQVRFILTGYDLIGFLDGTVSARRASGSQISEAERTVILLTGLPSDFDAVVSHASLSSSPLPFQRIVDALLECEARQMRSVSNVMVAANFVDGSSSPVLVVSSRGGRPPVRGRGRGFHPRIQCQIYGRYGHIAQRCYYRYHCDDSQPIVSSPASQGGPGVESSEDTWGRGQNWLPTGQNWSRPQPNVRAFPRGLNAPNLSAPNLPPGPNPFVSPGNRSPVFGPNVAGNSGRYSTPSIDPHSGTAGSYGARTRGPIGVDSSFGPGESVRPRLNDELNFSAPNANYVNVSDIPWWTKPRARVFDVDSSSYDSSQFVGIPRLPEFHASDFFDAMTYDSNFNSTDSYVPLPVGSTSWCPDSGATHHVCQNAADLHAFSLYTGDSSLLMGNGVSTKISSIESTVLPTVTKLLHLSNDIQTQEILMRGQVRDGLYHFFTTATALSPSIHNTTFQHQSVENDLFNFFSRWFIHSLGSELRNSKAIGVARFVPSHQYWLHMELFIALLANLIGAMLFALQFISLIVYPLQCWGVKHHINVCLIVYRHMIIFGCLDAVAFRTYVRLLNISLTFDPNLLHFCAIARNIKSPVCTSSYVLVLQPVPATVPRQVSDPISVPAAPDDSSSDVPSDPTFADVSVVASDPTVADAPVIARGPASSSTNTHAMVTPSKAGVFKPKALAVNTVDFEPVSVEEALAHPDWRLAELSLLPPGRKVIGRKWLFKVKKNPDGTIERRKARLAAKGCSQVPSCDFKETFSPVVKPTTIRVILPIVQPPGFVQHGLNDASLLVKISSDYTLYVLVYVDDIVITGSSPDKINCFVQQLHNKFALKDMGDLHYFLGIEVSRSTSSSLHLCQQKYVRELLSRNSMANAKSVHTPMVGSVLLSKDQGERLVDPSEYRSLAGALQYVVLTRLDIAYAVNRVCQFMHAPTKTHMVALKCILRYLRGTLSHGLVFRRSDRLSLVGYADANWGLDFDDRRSTIGYCMYFGHTLVSWYSKKQQVVSRSTAEAEYRSLAAATSDIAWLVSLLTELKIFSIDPPTIWCDNSSAVAVAANPVLHSKFKHVELDLFFVCEKVASGDLIVGEVPACDQVADILTKPLSMSLFTRFRHLLLVVSLEEAQ
ncbi:hypothetical protein CXB51_014023 [Gossypium anomalum]|uniref:Reverse transcriptase Ty1/copia-type domain-containing protein n=1 Tax=Gossypium anomalum TaxID=47600 RepID=A0A8J5YJC8_9ROSI|nr:hypothetical protein CXB51_014023 [Gossypium anomalum]